MKFNKLSALALTALLAAAGSASAALGKETTLANPNDFVILSDVQEPSLEVFLSYAGERFNHCGIALRHHSFASGPNDLARALKITIGLPQESDPAREIGEINNNGRLVAKVSNPKQTLYGQFFTITTRSGETLAKVLANLNPHRKTDVIIEILGCENGKPKL